MLSLSVKGGERGAKTRAKVTFHVKARNASTEPNYLEDRNHVDRFLHDWLQTK